MCLAQRSCGQHYSKPGWSIKAWDLHFEKKVFFNTKTDWFGCCGKNTSRIQGWLEKNQIQPQSLPWKSWFPSSESPFPMAEHLRFHAKLQGCKKWEAEFRKPDDCHLLKTRQSQSPYRIPSFRRAIGEGGGSRNPDSLLALGIWFWSYPQVSFRILAMLGGSPQLVSGE